VQAGASPRSIYNLLPMRFLRLSASLLLFCIAATTQIPKLVPRKVLFGNPEFLSPQVSPDGKMLAWIAPDANGVLNIWVRGLAEPAAKARLITTDPKRGIREAFFWKADGSRIVYIQDNDGDENWQVREVKIADPARDFRALTPAGTQARILKVSPDFPDQIIIALNQRDPRFHDAYRLNLKTGKLELLAENPGDVEYFEVDNAMQVRAAYAQLEDGSGEVRVRDIATSAWRKLASWSDEEVEGAIRGFTPDNKSLWYTTSVGANSAQLVETEIATGTTRLIATDKAQQYDAGDILTNPKTHALEAVEFNRAMREWEPVDPAMRTDLAALKKAHRGTIEILSRDKSDIVWTVAFNVDDGPVAYYTYNRQSKRARFLFHDRPELAKYKLAKMQPVEFPAADGLKLFGYLTLPPLPKAQQKNLPLIVYPHGGPYDRDDWGFYGQSQLFANRGYAVLQINYRGSTGYGKKHLQAGFRERGGKMSTDLIDGKNWAVAQGYAGPKKTCMYGVSYGGYAVLIALAFTPDEFTCGVEAYGASNLVSLLKSFPPYWTLYRRQWERRVGYAHEEEFLKSRSALFKVDQIKAPLLIGQGVNDPRVVKAESDQMVKALRDNGKQVEYLVYSDEGHGFLRPENRTKWFAAVESFLAEHLGGRKEPAGDGEDWTGLRK
jgi:dipeptidyl aminopeptidase/acylaminoacyl peptidase